MRKVEFVTNGVYHIYNRGADKRKIFCDDNDYLRFIYSICRFNCKKPFLHLTRDIVKQRYAQGRKSRGQSGRGWTSTTLAVLDKLVKLLYFVLMPNHFHLVLQQITERGIEKFIQKLGTGYAMYFNKKHDRNGVLFQGNYEAIPIESDSYLMQLSQYIHLNPVKLIEPEFREKGIKDVERARKFLKNYKWSSYIDYIGGRNFPFLLDNEFHNGYFKSSREYEDFVFQMVEVQPRPPRPQPRPVILS